MGKGGGGINIQIKKKNERGNYEDASSKNLKTEMALIRENEKN